MGLATENRVRVLVTNISLPLPSVLAPGLVWLTVFRGTSREISSWETWLGQADLVVSKGDRHGEELKWF